MSHVNSLEDSLKEVITVNQIHNIWKNDLKKEAASQRKNLGKGVASHKPYKGKLIKCTMRSIRTDMENKVKSEPESKRKNVVVKKSTENFIERLRQIEKVVDGDSFLDQTNDEIDIASKQLEEIQKLLANKLQKAEVVKNKYRNGEDNRKSRYHQHSPKDRVYKKLERLQKQYLNKPKIHYKSLKDIEILTNSRNVAKDYKQPEKVKHNHSEDNETKVVGTKTWKSKEPVLEKNMRNAHIQTQTNLRNSSKTFPAPEESEPKESVSRNVEKNISTKKKPTKFSSRFINRRKSSLLKVRLDDIPESSSSSDEPKSDGSSPSDLEYSDELNLTGHIFSRRKFKETSKARFLQEEGEVSGNNEDAHPPENGEEPLLNGVWAGLDESILKSEYLSKEFSIDLANKFRKVDKAAKKRSMQLLETTQGKFQDQQICRLANLKRRDQKLYTMLSTALKGTLFQEISQ